MTGCWPTGTVADLLPVQAARQLGADVVVAVDVRGVTDEGRPRPKTMLHLLIAAAHVRAAVNLGLRDTGELVITPPVDEYAYWEVNRVGEFEAAGYRAGQDAIDDVRKLLAEPGQDNDGGPNGPNAAAGSPPARARSA